MTEYWRTRPQHPASGSDNDNDNDNEEPFMSEYDRHRLSLLTHGSDEDWQLELRRYLQDIPADVTRDTNIVDWWSVSLHTLPAFAHCTNKL